VSRAVSIEIMSTASRLYETHTDRHAVGKWPWRSLKVIGIATIHHFLLVVTTPPCTMFLRYCHIYSVRDCVWPWEVLHFQKDSWNYKPRVL